MKAFAYRRVTNDFRDAADLADLLRMGRLPQGVDRAAAGAGSAAAGPPSRQAGRGPLGVEVSGAPGVLAACGVGVPMSDLFGQAGNQLLGRLALPAAFQARVYSLRRLLDPLDAEIALFGGMVAARLARLPATRRSRQSTGSGRCWQRCWSPRSAR